METYGNLWKFMEQCNLVAIHVCKQQQIMEIKSYRYYIPDQYHYKN